MYARVTEGVTTEDHDSGEMFFAIVFIVAVWTL